MSEIPPPAPQPEVATSPPSTPAIPARLVATESQAVLLPASPAAPDKAGQAQTGPKLDQALQATVLDSKLSGRLILATDQGKLEVIARQAIPVGTRLLVVARETAGDGTLLLIPENDRGTKAAATPRPLPPSPGSSAFTPQASLPATAVGIQPQRLQAVVQQAVTLPLPLDLAGRPLPPVSTGSRIALQLLAVTGTQAGLPGAAPTASTEAASLAPPPQAPDPMAFRPVAPAGAAQIEGRVTGLTTEGRPVITTALGTLQMDRPANLPVGAGLLLAFDGPLPAQSGLPDGASRPLQALGWQILSEILATAPALDEAGAASSPAGSAPPAQAALPQPGRRLASSLLFFLSALRGGDLTGWLEAGVLASRDPSKLGNWRGRLSQEAGQASRQAEQTSSDWRLYPIPLLYQGRIEPLNLLVRRQKNTKPGQGDEAELTRFLLEVELSALGEIQLDGLTRARRFDLILRSRRALTATMRSDVTAIFESANAVTGASGQIAFHASAGWSFLGKRLSSAADLDRLVV